MAKTRIIICGRAEWNNLPRKAKKELTTLMRKTIEREKRREKDDQARRVRDAA